MQNIDLRLCETQEPMLYEILQIIAEFPGCLKISALPDCHVRKNKQTTPNGIVSLFDGYIIPQLLTKSINCGMGLLKFQIPPDELLNKKQGLIKNFHEMLNEESPVLSKDNLVEILDADRTSALSVFKSGKIDRLDDVAEVEMGNLLEFESERIDIDEIIPGWIYDDEKMLSMPGNNFGGNHFFEWQRVGEIAEGECAADFDSENSYCFFHFDAPITKVVSQNFARKTENEEFTPVPLGTYEGQRFLASIRFGMNFGLVARLSLIEMIALSVERTFGKEIAWGIICEAGHSTFDAELYEGRNVLVSRKGCVRTGSSAYGVVAGSYNTPSIIVKKEHESAFETPWFCSYDHGIEYHLWRDNEFCEIEKVGKVLRYVFPEKGAGWGFKSLSEDDVYVGPAIRHVISIYKKHSNSPVKPVGFLIPMMNYKLKRKTY